MTTPQDQEGEEKEVPQEVQSMAPTEEKREAYRILQGRISWITPGIFEEIYDPRFTMDDMEALAVDFTQEVSSGEAG